LRNVFAGAVSENAISAVGHQASLAAVIAGIRADTSLDLRVSENTITNVAPPTDFQNPAAGVLVVGPLAHIDIAANLIRRQLTPNDDNSPWEAVRILTLKRASRQVQSASFTIFPPTAGKCDQ